MLNLQKHKDFLWKYTLSYGKLLRNEEGKRIFPFDDIIMEDDRSIEDYKTENLQQRLQKAIDLEAIYDLVSTAYKDYYFMEISSLLHDDEDMYSTLLLKTFTLCGTKRYISAKNYEHLAAFAHTDAREKLLQQLKKHG